MRLYPTVAVAVAGLLGASPAPAQTAAVRSAPDRAGVERAALDYVEGFYEGDSLKLARSVRPEVVKLGFYHARGDTAYRSESMTYPEFFAYARQVREHHRQRGAEVPRSVAVLDVLDQTAAAKVTAWWGVDYLHLARYDGRWMIVHILWQDPPPQR